MKGSHNLSTDVKVIKNVKRSNSQIIANNFFATFQNNQMNYVNLQNHDNLNMI
jgi:hypothetical protein